MNEEALQTIRQPKYRAWFDPKDGTEPEMWYDVGFDRTTVFFYERNWNKLVHPPVMASIGREVDGLVLEQFTGLYDGESTEVYEGDFLQANVNGIVFCSVIWHRCGFTSKFYGKTALQRYVRDGLGDAEGRTYLGLPSNLTGSGSPWTVVGNIHQHQHLLTSVK